MKLRARWLGSPPRVGDYLASAVRPRFAYLVRALECPDSKVRWDAESKTEMRRLAIEVDRVPIGDLPSTALVHDWRWDKRAARRGARAGAA